MAGFEVCAAGAVVVFGLAEAGEVSAVCGGRAAAVSGEELVPEGWSESLRSIDRPSGSVRDVVPESGCPSVRVWGASGVALGELGLR